MRCGEDKIIVATARNGVVIYFSVRDDGDHGTIIDFVQRRSRQGGIGGVAGYAAVAAASVPGAPAQADVATHTDARFAGRVRIDARRNAVFAHYDREALCGYEVKKRQFTGFSPGGEKGLWYSTDLRNAPRVLIVQSAIDAMSHAQIRRDPDAAYISVGGTMNDKQPDLLRGAIEKAAARGARIVVATDRDLAGDRLAEQIKGLAPAATRIERKKPAVGKDWNEQMQRVRQAREIRSPAMRVHEKANVPHLGR